MYVCTKVCVYLCVRLPSFSLTVRSLSHALSRRQVKRKYGTKVQELQKECVNKRRRANLPKSAVGVRSPSFDNKFVHVPSGVRSRVCAKR